MNKFFQFCSLAWTRAVVSKQQFIDFLLTSTTYYGNWKFAKVDLRLLMLYFWKNPFRVSKSYLKSVNASDLYVYGETPLTTMQLICKKAGVTSADSVLELGCGRGRTCFWLREYLGCRVVGIDQVPEFIDHANEIKDYFHIDGLEFLKGDYLTAEWGNPSVIYLYASNLHTTDIILLSKKMRAMPKSTKVISVSFPIPGMIVLRRFQAAFTWGEADVYVQFDGEN